MSKNTNVYTAEDIEKIPKTGHGVGKLSGFPDLSSATRGHIESALTMVPYANVGPAHRGQADLPLHINSTGHHERRGTPDRLPNHQFIGNTSHDDSDHLLGDLGQGPPGVHVQGHKFAYNKSHDTSLMMSGTIDMSEAASILKEKWAGKRKEKAAERKAAGGRPLQAGVKKLTSVRKRKDHSRD